MTDSFSRRPRTQRNDTRQGKRNNAHGNAKKGTPAASRTAGYSANKVHKNEKRADTRNTSAQASRIFGLSPKDSAQISTGLSMNARRIALQILCDVHQNGAYASLSLDKHLRQSQLKIEDRALVTELVYGTIEKQNRIDFVLNKFIDHPVREPAQTDILRMGVYQILFLDRVPNSAAVNEAVKLVKILGMDEASGFINAVLRNIVRGKENIEWPVQADDPRYYLHVMGNMPLWLIDKLTEAYGDAEAERIIMHRPSMHYTVLRPNMMKLDDDAFEKMLDQKGWKWIKGIAPHAYLVIGVSHITSDLEYQRGSYSIQGQSSILCAEAMQPKIGMKLLDACAAPGGKSAYLCEKMNLTGRVYAWELHEKRAALLEAMRKRLMLDNLRITVRDSTVFKEDWEKTLDGVLLDAPCSGTGVIAEKPDIPTRLKEEDIPAIVETQKELLNTVCRYVKAGGRLVYSTCSILPEENTEQVQRFLSEHPDFEIDTLPESFPEEIRKMWTPYGLQLIGYRDEVEGFFIAPMRRVR